MASVGGFCVSTGPNINHQVRTLDCMRKHVLTFLRQRLNSSGYCFSASSPPYLVASATAAIDQIKPDRLERLAQNTKLLRAALQKVKGVNVDGDAVSPVIHLTLKTSRGSRLEDETLLQQVVEAAEVPLETSIHPHPST